MKRGLMRARARSAPVRQKVPAHAVAADRSYRASQDRRSGRAFLPPLQSRRRRQHPRRLPKDRGRDRRWCAQAHRRRRRVARMLQALCWLRHRPPHRHVTRRRDKRCRWIPWWRRDRSNLQRPIHMRRERCRKCDLDVARFRHSPNAEQPRADCHRCLRRARRRPERPRRGVRSAWGKDRGIAPKCATSRRRAGVPLRQPAILPLQ